MMNRSVESRSLQVLTANIEPNPPPPQLLGACIEIPQLGKIRSLNVHVSGALVLYEHARQRLLAQ